MLYRILHFLMKRSIVAHYLEVKGIGLNNIPKKGPILIAATHPNSFLDAIIIAVSMNRPLYFLARSDVFKAKWAENILRSMNLIPIYRMQEGAENLNKNQDTFNECFKILEKGGAVLIFAEGISLIDKKLRPLKKGLGRIAFGFSEQNDFRKNVKVVPLSLNYDRPTSFRSKVLIGVGEAIDVGQFQKTYEGNKNKGVIELNKLIFDALKAHTIEVEEEHHLVYKTITELDSSFIENSLARKILMANKIKEVSHENVKEFEMLQQESAAAFSTLKKYNLNFRKLKINTGLPLIEILKTVLLAPLAFVAFVVNFFPFWIAKRVATKKVKLVEFYASVRLVLATILWLVWALFIMCVGMNYSLLFLLTLPALYFAILFYLWYYEKSKYFSSAIQLRKLRKNETLYEELQGRIKHIYRLRKSLQMTNK